MNSLIGFPLHHTEQAPVDHLEGIGLQVGEHEEQPIFRRRQGQLVYTVNRRAVRGFRPIRHAAIRTWNAASKGGTSCRNSSRVTLVKSRNSIVTEGEAKKITTVGLVEPHPTLT